ncbi:SusC/RagA family TonB-linked outer membrane protein [Salegentibacter echinorum]|nr:SusC/RagA family TonB-linked outer membrane protein [Salegentibacter echinorum]
MLAQEKTVSGTVIDTEGAMPLPGVTILEKGTSNGVSTDFDGNYSITVAEDATLVFTMIGYKKQEISVAGKTTIDVSLGVDTEALDEVVVTALGIKREQKSLGYALQEVGGEELIESRESNLANAFTGKVAGLNVVRGSGGPASSSKIVLRGNNSLTGDNQPLIVVDGVPMDNFTGAENNDYFNPSRDTGNGLGDIDPENIESMSVLKGASAAALYGSRAGNGVILITTKSGTAQEGLGITYNVNLGFEDLFLKPDMQSSFAQGSNNIYNAESTLSWGPKIEGQTVTDYTGEEVPLRAYNNVENFFDTGVSLNQSLSFSQKINNTSVYSSVSYLDDESMIPGAELNRTNLLTRATTTFGPNERWTTDVKVQYMNNKAINRPLGGANVSNAFLTMYLLPRSVDITDFSTPKDEFGNMTWYNSSNQVNPYWNAKYNTNKDSRDRFLLNGSVKYEFADWLTGEIKGGSDMYTTSTEKKVYDGSPIVDNGQYSLGKRTFMENNFSALFTARKDDILGNFGVSGNLGGNLMHRKSSKLESNVGELEVPDFFSINNGVDRPNVTEGSTEYKINSLYGTVQLNYDGYLFLDLTGRNDWSSSLSEDNRSFFYPSVSTSIVLNDLIKDTGGEMPGWITFSKLRASYAEVGNDLDPYQLYNSYYLGKNSNDETIAGRRNTLFNPDLQSELIKSWEAGFDLRFLDNRIGLDFSWYKTNATRQLIEIDLNPLSGYLRKKVNAGDIENQGIEVMLNATILDNPEGLSWSTNINFSKNENTLNELTPDLDRYKLGGYDNVEIIAEAGSGYGNIYGTKFRRVEDQNSPYFGELILDESGLPLETDESFYLGNQQPDALVGWTNSFKWKRFNFSFLIDGRFGGKIFSGTNAAMQLQGTANATVVNGQREEFVVDGVVDVTPEGASDRVFEENQAAVSHQNYWEAVAGVGNLGITEANMYDATNIRLRNINLSYNLPKDWIDVLALTKAKVGVSANNLWMIDSDMNGIDPESVYATGTNATGFENGSSPTSRSYFFNVSLSF